MDKGGELIENTLLFGKYQLMRTLGHGRSGTVYLAFHQELKEYRAIKQVPKACTGYEQFKKEALLLTSLSHPGIPMVYDLEEDCSCSYLIEEYLEGDTLYDLVRDQGHLNQEAVIRIGMQVCDLVHYLHSAGETPILYLDLQPKNLLFCHGHVKLLDFGHAGLYREANEASLRYGTPGFCAPEQKTGGRLGIYTDIYQIGALLYYLSTGKIKDETDEWPGDRTLGRIIEICVRRDEERRYPSVPELKQELEALYFQTGVFKEHPSSSLIFAVAGSRHGAGSTHLAIGLARYLNQAGYEALYEERNPSGDVRAMAQRCKSVPDSYGICRIRQVAMKPRYGEAVRLKTADYPIIVRDYGTQWDAALEDGEITALWLVHGGKWWEQEAGLRAMGRLKDCPGFVLLYNRAVAGMRPDYPEGVHKKRCFQVPDFKDPWQIGPREQSFFRELMKLAEGFEDREGADGKAGRNRRNRNKTDRNGTGKRQPGNRKKDRRTTEKNGNKTDRTTTGQKNAKQERHLWKRAMRRRKENMV